MSNRCKSGLGLYAQQIKVKDLENTSVRYKKIIECEQRTQEYQQQSQLSGVRSQSFVSVVS